MTKGEMIQAKAIKVLEDAGWVAAGATASNSFRVGGASAPVYGGMGGSICNVGGRQRYTKPGTNVRVTVGKITTCFYEIVDNAATKHVNIPTSDEDRIRLFATGQMAKGEHEMEQSRSPAQHRYAPPTGGLSQIVRIPHGED